MNKDGTAPQHTPPQSLPVAAHHSPFTSPSKAPSAELNAIQLAVHDATSFETVAEATEHSAEVISNNKKNRDRDLLNCKKKAKSHQTYLHLPGIILQDKLQHLSNIHHHLQRSPVLAGQALTLTTKGS